MGAAIAILLMLGIPGMLAGYAVGHRLGDAEWPWWAGLVASGLVAFIMARVSVWVITWDQGHSGSGDLLGVVALWWNLGAVFVVTAVGFGLGRDFARSSNQRI